MAKNGKISVYLCMKRYKKTAKKGEIMEIVRYSSRKDRDAAWLLAFVGIVGAFDFYMRCPVKGGVKLGIVIVSSVCACFDGVTSLLGYGIDVVCIWNVWDMFLLSRGRYRDGNGFLVKKETRDATILFWLAIVLPVALVVFLLVGILTGSLRLPVA